MSDLKPCPFCGSEAHASSHGTHGCKSCAFYLVPDAWNRRAPRFSPEEREALEAARQSLEVHTQELQDPIDDCPEREAAATIRKMLEEK